MFKNHGINPSEIVVIVIFDGIEKVNNENDEELNILNFFKKQDFDFNINQPTKSENEDEFTFELNMF